MGHHINREGNFQSDKYPELPENKIILSFNDPLARKVLYTYAQETEDRELGDDMLQVLRKYKGEN